MDRLPVELISHIFILGCEFAGFYKFIRSQFYLPDPMDPLKGINNHHHAWDRFRVSITSVSRTWRQVAYATTELWSIIDIRRMKLRSYTPLSFVTACLEHSKTQPLDIALYGVEVLEFMTIWDLIAPALPRCRSLHLIIPSVVFRSIAPLPESLSLLEEVNFTIDLPAHDSIFLSTMLFPSAVYLPKLRRLMVTGFYERMIVHAPLEGLHEFAYQSTDPLSRSSLARLRQAHNLVLNSDVISPDTDSEPLELPHVRILEFHDPFIASMIRAPNAVQLKAKTAGFVFVMGPDTFPQVREIDMYSSLSVEAVAWLHSPVGNMSSFRLMPSVEILRLPPQDPRELSISLFTLLNSETAITSNDPPQQSPARLFPSLRKLYCQKIYPAVDNRHFKKVDRELDDRLVQLLRQRPLLSIIVAAPIMTPSRMEDIAPGLGGRVFNSDTESEAVVW